MSFYTDLTCLPPEIRGSAAALGNFDGVHLGHVHLLDVLKQACPGHPLSVITFEPHPREYFRPQDPAMRLLLPHVRRRHLVEHGVNHVFQIPFNREFSLVSPDQFICDVLRGALGVKHVACGPDFAFGYRRAGDVHFLQEHLSRLDIGLTIVPPFGDESGPYSSSRIRRLLQEGYPERAAAELGRPWALVGTVVHGEKRGRLFGFPTANVLLGRQLEPARGVYAVSVERASGEKNFGVANIGRRPTIDDALASRLEVHLFDFSGDLYGQELTVSLYTMLREEVRFASIEALKHQIGRDIETARAYFDRDGPKDRFR